jgi:hypothetical protein
MLMNRPVFLPSTYHPGGTTGYLRRKVRAQRWLIVALVITNVSTACALYFL